MSKELREVISMTMRPSLKADIDKLAGKFGLSRSETVHRLLAQVVPPLVADRPDGCYIDKLIIRRKYLDDILKI